MNLKKKLNPSSITIVENYLALFFVALLVFLPLLFKILGFFSLQIPNNENAIINFVFAFACFSGIITWREGNHINLASLTESLPERFKAPLQSFRSLITITILTALFLTAFSAAFTIFPPTKKIWGVPLFLFFSLLPLSYFTMLIRSLLKKDFLVQNFIGFAIGLFISLGPLSGVLYSIFKFENLNFLLRI